MEQESSTTNKQVQQDEQDEQVIICSNCGNYMHMDFVVLYESRDSIDSAGRKDGLFVEIPAYVCPVCENWT